MTDINHKFTQEEFDALPVDKHGIKHCPSGDYTNIKKFPRCNFGEWCSFGKWCSFAERCSFGKWCSFAERCSFGNECSFEGKKALFGFPFLAIDGAGSRYGKTYAFNVEGGPIVRCGCFVGSIDEFRAKVIQKYGTSKCAMIYLGWANLVALQFDRQDLIDYGVKS